MQSCRRCCTQLTNVTVKDGQTTLLQDINLHIHCDELLGIVGPNGGGKTTLLRTLLGEMPYTGKLTFLGHKGEAKEKIGIGYVPQHLHFDASAPLTVLELFAICLTKRPAWLPITKTFKESVVAALEEVQLAYALERPLGVLSGGELQRALLALALMPTPDLLLLDEPISGVDVVGQELFYEKVHALKQKHHMAIVLITHDVEALEKRCDRAVLLSQRILAEGHPEEVKEKAKGVMTWKRSTAL